MNYGRYEIVKELGRGSMGVVYLARDPNIERLVAVKVLRQDRMGNESFVRRFVKEAKVIGRLSHPSIVTVHDIGQEQGEVYIAMEYIEGKTLSDIIKEKRLDVKEIVEYGVQIAETLEYAHHKGVIHRDIKPSNIIIQPDGHIKITDFGIARIEDSNASIQTQAGETMGTPSYMSPEQVLGKSVDGRSDLFSLGVVLYELTTGKRPFGGEGKTLATVFNEIIQLTPPDPKIISGKIPKELSTLIMKSLQKEPVKRFQSCMELAESLKTCLAKGKKEEVVLTSPVTPAPGKKIGYLVPLVGAALITIVTGGIFFFSHQKEAPPLLTSSESIPPPRSEATIREQPKATPMSAPAPPIMTLAATVKKEDAPERNMPKETVTPTPPPVPVRSNIKQTLKAESKPSSEAKSSRSIVKREKPAYKKALSMPELPSEDTNAARTKFVRADTALNENQLKQNVEAQLPPPVTAQSLPKFAFLKVQTTPKGAVVFVNGIKKGISPLTLKLNFGKYRVALYHAGYHNMECLINLDRMTEYPIIEKLRPIE